MTVPAAAIQPVRDPASTRPARDRRLATVLSGSTLVWVLDERFDPAAERWTVDILRADAQQGWRRQRYMYDAASDLLVFWGERPLDAAEVRALNLRTLPRFAPQGSAPSPAAQPVSATTAGAVSPAQPSWGVRSSSAPYKGLVEKAA
ncbi:MAG TPA: hypothetical protein VNL77_16335 [Roseiflexaceae bacterium]|nr:hypothetical protein [Roseiflexaceae bacterium]